MDTKTMCEVCNNEIVHVNEIITIKKLDLCNFIKTSKIRDDNKWSKWEKCDEIIVHDVCAKCYISDINNSRKRSRSDNKVLIGNESVTSSSETHLSERCIICNEICQKDVLPKNRRAKSHGIPKNSPWKDRLLSVSEGHNDPESLGVMERLLSVEDLTAAGARYHLYCISKYIGKRDQKKKVTNIVGIQATDQIEKLCKIIDGAEECQWTMTQLIEILDEPSLSPSYIKHMLKKHYGDENILFSSRGDTKMIVNFRSLPSSDKALINFIKCGLPGDNIQERKRNIIKAASILIREDICSKDYDLDVYPEPADFFSSDNIEKVIPDSLQLFLEDIIMPKKVDTKTSSRRITNIAHAIISATRPSTFMSALQLALALYVRYKSQCKALVNILNQLGVCAPYSEASIYESSAVMTETPLVRTCKDHFLEYTFGNDKDSMHITGGIECSIQKRNTDTNDGIERLNIEPNPDEIIAKEYIKIYHFQQPEKRGLLETPIEDLRKIRELNVKCYLFQSEIPWNCGYWLKMRNHSDWSGFAEIQHSFLNQQSSKIKYLPFIDLKEADNNTLLSAMLFAVEQGVKIGQKNIFLTFNHQLYLKAREIVADVQLESSELKTKMNHVFVRLDGLDIILSFMASIGFVMAGSGLEDAWSTIYSTKNQNIEKMMSGKKYASGLRAHYLTQTSLLLPILDLCNITDDEKTDGMTLLLSVSQLEDPLMRDVKFIKIIDGLKLKIEEQIESIKNRGKVSVLWLQYIKMVSLLRRYVKAEKFGDFYLHLSTIFAMLPFFHISNHHHLALCAHIYVQDMLKLGANMEKSSDFATYIKSGYFTIRRTSKFFSAVSHEIVIEQALKHRFNDLSDIVCDRKNSDSVATSRLNAIATPMYVTSDLEQFCDVPNEFNETFNNLISNVINNDTKDIKTLSDWFKCHQPFLSVSDIMSIGTGVVGGAEINCHEAESLGCKSMDKVFMKVMIDIEGQSDYIAQSFGSMKISKEFRVLPLSAAHGRIEINSTIHPINAFTIFQRFTRSTVKEKMLAEYFQYELSPFPVSMFECSTKMRRSKDNKDILSLFKPCDAPTTNNMRYIIDVETLISLIDWTITGTYRDLYNQIVIHVVEYFSYRSTVVFESQKSPAVHPKWAEMHRSTSLISADAIQFDITSLITITKEQLFANHSNKIQFFTQLAVVLKKFGINVKESGDKEVEAVILDEAIEITSHNETAVVVSNNVEVLLLLLAKNLSSLNIYFHNYNGEWYSTSTISEQYEDLTPYLLIIYAFTGCKTTSSLYGKPIKIALEQIKKAKTAILPVLEFFYKPATDSHHQLRQHGEIIMLKIYNGSGESLDQYRYTTYVKALEEKMEIDSDSILINLPPTSTAAQFHVSRVFWQIQAWLNNPLPADHWGWRVIDGILIPVETTLSPAPDAILNAIRCCCSNCEPLNCNCRTAGLPCLDFCEHCTDTNCSNIPTIRSNIDEEDEDIDDVMQISHVESQDIDDNSKLDMSYVIDCTNHFSDCQPGPSI